MESSRWRTRVGAVVVVEMKILAIENLVQENVIADFMRLTFIFSASAGNATSSLW